MKERKNRVFVRKKEVSLRDTERVKNTESVNIDKERKKIGQKKKKKEKEKRDKKESNRDPC